MKIKKKILAVTGIRSEYDILYPVLKILQDSDDFELQVVVSGAHLSYAQGNTVQRIEQDGFQIVDRIDTLLATDRLSQRPKAVAALISGLTQTVERIQPDFLLVVGDREESIATAIVGNYMDVLVAHIGGGDPVFGNADDPVRMAVSKLAHIHFTTTQEYADNLLELGEESWRISFCGTPGLDNIANEKRLSLAEVSAALKFSLTNYLVLLKHPLSSEYMGAYEQMKITLAAVDQFCQRHDFQCVVIQPNSDPGSSDILKAMDEYQSSRLIFTKTLPRHIFVNLLRHAQVLVGNSSMGLLEAPMYKLPVVNVGHRQQGRLNAGNVEFVGHDVEIIVAGIAKAAFDQVYRKRISGLNNPYGDGHASQRILSFLLNMTPSDYSRWHLKSQLIKPHE